MEFKRERESMIKAISTMAIIATIGTYGCTQTMPTTSEVYAPWECTSFYEPRAAVVKRIDERGRYVYDCSFNGGSGGSGNGGDGDGDSGE